MKQHNSGSKVDLRAGELSCGMRSSLILLLFLLVSFGFGAFFTGGKVWDGIWGPFFNILKKPRKGALNLPSESEVLPALPSESEVLALGDDAPDSKLLGQSSSRTPRGEQSSMTVSSKFNDLNSNHDQNPNISSPTFMHA